MSRVRLDTLHSGPAVGFDEPFEMLAACHDRIRRSLDLLRRLDAHVDRHGANAQAREAAADVLRYFDLAGPKHHEDEERHVLPRLRNAGLAAMADRLEAEHRELEGLWSQLREPLLSWTRHEPGVIGPTMLKRFLTLYETHLALEDQEAFAAARDGLDEPSLARMGEEMASRRRS
ncbi:hemerythrin domain-containing protein [Roseateles sp. NT4]|uniref:hemerythrin domain-containing protein n=1 Tax=Roseateles sp. NT4 TaxID=3453715 RepID=UPI003EE9BA6F